MTTQVFSVVGQVSADRTLDSMADEIEAVSADFSHGRDEINAASLMQLAADYRATHNSRAAQFQESASQMHTPVRPTSAALSPKHAQAQQDGLSKGVIPVTPDHGFVPGTMPTDLMPSMERDE